MRGLITSIFDWLQHPYNSNENVMDWLSFLTLTLIVAFLWATVVSKISEG